MLPPTHLLLSLLFAKLFSTNLKETAVLAFSSLLPDIDLLVRRHRKEMHSLPFAFLLAFLIPTSYRSYFLLGYLFHLLLDSANRSGIQLLWPITKKRVRGPISIGSIEELLLDSMFLLALILL